MRMKKGSFKNVTVAFILGTMTVSVLTPTLSYGEDNISSEKKSEERNEKEEILNKSLENKNGFVYENASWNFYKNGEIYRKRDIVHGVINGISGWYYVNNGKRIYQKQVLKITYMAGGILKTERWIFHIPDLQKTSTVGGM